MKPEIIQNSVAGQYQKGDILLRRKKFHQNENPYIDLDQEVFLRIDKESPQTILDVGCGYGDLLINLAKRDIKGNLYGIDISAGMVAAAKIASNKSHLAIQFQEANGETLPFPDQFFDTVIAKYSLHVMENINKAIEEIFRVLKPNGKFIIMTRSNRSMANFDHFRESLGKHFGLTLVPTQWSRFTIEMAPKFCALFTKQDFSTLETTIRLTGAEPFIDYLDTFHAYFSPIPDDNLWKKILEEAKKEVSKIITANGSFEQQVVHGIGVCTK